MAAACGIVAIFWYVENLFRTAKKIISYEFENNILPFTKKRYEELFAFLQQYPLSDHDFTNEFLPFSIAFGIDTSWNRDFGIEKEINVTPS